MKSEELFFEDLNFFRFFFSAAAKPKNAPLFHLFFFTFFASFFLFVCNCLSLSSHFSFTHHDSLSSLSSFGARRAFGVFFITRGGGRAKNNFE